MNHADVLNIAKDLEIDEPFKLPKKVGFSAEPTNLMFNTSNYYSQ